MSTAAYWARIIERSRQPRLNRAPRGTRLRLGSSVPPILGDRWLIWDLADRAYSDDDSLKYTRFVHVLRSVTVWVLAAIALQNSILHTEAHLADRVLTVEGQRPRSAVMQFIYYNACYPTEESPPLVAYSASGTRCNEESDCLEVALHFSLSLDHAPKPLSRPPRLPDNDRSL